MCIRHVTAVWDCRNSVPFQIVSQKTATQLCIKFPQSSDSGNYTCEALSPYGRCETSTHVYVQPKTEAQQNIMSSHCEVIKPETGLTNALRTRRHEGLSERTLLSPRNDTYNNSKMELKFIDCKKVFHPVDMEAIPIHEHKCKMQAVNPSSESKKPTPITSEESRDFIENSTTEIPAYIRRPSTLSVNSDLAPPSPLPTSNGISDDGTRMSEKRRYSPIAVIDSRISRVLSPIPSEADASSLLDLRTLRLQSIRRDDDPTRWTVRELRALFETKQDHTTADPTQCSSHSSPQEEQSTSTPSTLRLFKKRKKTTEEQLVKAFAEKQDSKPYLDNDSRPRNCSTAVRRSVRESKILRQRRSNEPEKHDFDLVNGVCTRKHIINPAKDNHQYTKSGEQNRTATETSELKQLQIDQLKMLLNENKDVHESQNSCATMNGIADGFHSNTEPSSAGMPAHTPDKIWKRNIPVKNAMEDKPAITTTGTTNNSISTCKNIKLNEKEPTKQQLKTLVSQDLTVNSQIGHTNQSNGFGYTGNQPFHNPWLSSNYASLPSSTTTTPMFNWMSNGLPESTQFPLDVLEVQSVNSQLNSKDEQQGNVVISEALRSLNERHICCPPKNAEKLAEGLDRNTSKTNRIPEAKLLEVNSDSSLTTTMNMKEETRPTVHGMEKQCTEQPNDIQLRRRPKIEEHLLKVMPSEGTENVCANRGSSSTELSVSAAPRASAYPSKVTQPRKEVAGATSIMRTSDASPTLTDGSSDVEGEGCDVEYPLNIKTIRDIDPKKYFFPISPLGEGQFGKVHACVCRKTGATYALKKFRFARLQRHQGELMEVAVLRAVGKHPQIAHLVAAFEFKGNCTIITELATGGALFERIEAEGCLDESITVQIIKQLLMGLKHLKKCQVLHCDLKPENLIMCKPRGYQLKIIDFGLACFYDSAQTRRRPAGTLTYLAPETQNYDPQSYATDLWSVAVIAYEILAGITPFEVPHDGDPERKLSKNEISINITKVRYNLEESGIVDASDEAKDFIKRILVRQPEKRPTVEECLKHAWMTIPDVKRPTITRKLSLYRCSTRRKPNRGGKVPGRTHSLNKSETDT